tara:strand:- start:120 stop:269 length:150 start_codon:yes stop_codon:yes gene_type:complete
MRLGKFEMERRGIERKRRDQKGEVEERYREEERKMGGRGRERSEEREEM